MSWVTPGSLAVIRLATLDDVPALERLIEASARGLTRPDYTSEQVEAALGTAWGVDTQLIRDGTYFVAELEGTLVACGGWSRRGTSFGGDHLKDRRPELLDPTRDAARIRAFFVLPEWARRGLGRMLLGHCEQAALDAGFQAVELVATLPGHRLYRSFGYEGDDRVRYELPGQVSIDFIPMRKRLVSG